MCASGLWGREGGLTGAVGVRWSCALGGEEGEVVLECLAFGVRSGELAPEKLLMGSCGSADDAVDVLTNAQGEFSDEIGPLIPPSKFTKGIWH